MNQYFESRYTEESPSLRISYEGKSLTFPLGIDDEYEDTRELYDTIESAFKCSLDKCNIESFGVEAIDDCILTLLNRNSFPISFKDFKKLPLYKNLLDFMYYYDYPIEGDEESVVAYLYVTNGRWDTESHDNSYFGKFSSDKALMDYWLSDWDVTATELGDYWDYKKFGESIWNDFNLDSYTPEALEAKRHDLEKKYHYSFIGDYSEEEGEESYSMGVDEDKLNDEMYDFEYEHEVEIDLASLGDYEEVGIEYFNKYMRYEDLTHQDVDLFFRKDDYLVYLMKYKFASYNNRYFRKEYM